MYACYKITLCNYYFIFFRVHKNSLFLLKGNDLVMKIETPKSKVDAFNWKRIIRSKELLIITYFPDTFLDNKLGERAEFSNVSYSLRIKNLGLNESGLYQALDSSKEALIIADYHVTVQGMLTETECRYLMQAVSL